MPKSIMIGVALSTCDSSCGNGSRLGFRQSQSDRALYFMPRKTKQQIGDGPGIGSPVVDSRQHTRPKERNSAPASNSKVT